MDIHYQKLNILNNLNKKNVFWYFVIFCVIVYAFSKTQIGLNVVFGSIVGFLLLWYLYDDHTNRQKENKDLINKKRNSIIPPIVDSLKHNEIVDFLFSIQDLYVYNPQAYEDMVEQIDFFFRLYQEVQNDNSLAGQDYELLENAKRQALNSLQSIIHNMAPNKGLDDKLDNAVSLLNVLLQKYLNDVKKINNVYIYETGISLSTKLIEINKKDKRKIINLIGVLTLQV